MGRSHLSEKIGLFLATLELIRQARINLTQEEASHTIHLELRNSNDSQVVIDHPPTDWRDPDTGEIQYDWPTEEARCRAERLAKLRLKKKLQPTKESVSEKSESIQPEKPLVTIMTQVQEKPTQST